VRGDEGTLLDEKDIWINRVCGDLGLGVFNVSTPGNYNKNMIRQMIDFFSLPVDVIARCKLIIAEPRVGDYAGRLSIDLLEEFMVEPETMVPAMLDSTAYHNMNVRTHSWASRVFMPFISPTSIGKSSMEYATDQVTCVVQSEFASPDAIKLASDYIDMYSASDAISVGSTIDDFDDIRTMKQFVDMAKIPFAWFCWDHNNSTVHDDIVTCETIFTKTSSIFDARIPAMNIGATAAYELGYGYDALQENKCDCGHYGEAFHKWVSDIVLEHISNMDIK